MDTPPVASELNETEGLVVQHRSIALSQTSYLLEDLQDGVHYIAQVYVVFSGGPQSMRSEYVYVSFQQGELVVVHWDRTGTQEPQITPTATDTSSTTRSTDTIPPVTGSGRDRIEDGNNNRGLNQILIGEEISSRCLHPCSFADPKCTCVCLNMCVYVYSCMCPYTCVYL